MIFVNHFNGAQAAKDYLSHLVKGDYFAKDAEKLTPTFEGELAKRLGLEGQAVTAESFGSLIDNVHPVTGEKLTVRTKDDRRSMTDLTFDVPKSVSLAAVVDPRVKGVIDQALDETMREIEREAATRVRKDGQNEDRVTGNMLWAVWAHDTARPLEDGTVDPQEHRHVTVLNMTHDPVEGRIKALQLGSVVRDKGYWQALYHSKVDVKLRGLGYGIEKDGNSFRIQGISKELCEKFSRRHAVIDAAAQAKGIESKAGRAKLAKVTRNRKGEELSTKELREEWLSRMTPEEVKALKDSAGGIRHDAAFTPDIAVQYAIDHTFQRESTTSERKLVAEALRHGVGSVLPDEIHREVGRRKDVIRVKRGDQVMVTTRTTLDREIEMLKLARDGHGQAKPFAVDEAQLSHLDAEGQKAARDVLKSRDWVVGIQGGAGTGKTTLLKTVRSAVEKQAGIMAFAQSSTASRGVLREAGFENATTLATLFKSEQMQRSVRGNVLIVDESSLVGTEDMLKTLRIAKEQGARKVLFVGDTKQHHSIQAGDAFRLLQQEAGVRFAELKTIRRQKVEGYRKAAEVIAKGDHQKGFDMLDKQGAIVQAPHEVRHGLLVEDYLQAVKDQKSALIISPTHKEGDALTDEIREALKANGTLGKREHKVIIRKRIGWTDPQKGDARNYEPGMVIEFHEAVSGERVRRDGKRVTIGGIGKGEVAVVTGQEHARVKLLRQNGEESYLPKFVDRFEVYSTDEIGIAKGERLRITKNGSLDHIGKSTEMVKRLNNGDIFTVEGFTKDGDLKLDNGMVLPKTYGHFKMGYVDTSVGGQGKTVDRVFTALGSVLAVNSKEWYVDVTRASEAVKVYVDDKQEIRDAIKRSGQRLSAVELVKPDWQNGPAQARRSRVMEMLDRNRILSYVREKAAAVREWRQRRQGVSHG